MVDGAVLFSESWAVVGILNNDKISGKDVADMASLLQEWVTCL